MRILPGSATWRSRLACASLGAALAMAGCATDRPDPRSVHSGPVPEAVKAKKTAVLPFGTEQSDASGATWDDERKGYLIDEGRAKAVAGRNRAVATMGQAVADELTVRMHAKGFNLIERADLTRLWQEQDLAATARLDMEKVVKIGKQVGADYVLVGSVQTYAVGGTLTHTTGQMTVYARLVDVELGRIAWSARETVHAKRFEAWGMDEMQNVLDDLVVEAGRRLAGGM